MTTPPPDATDASQEAQEIAEEAEHGLRHQEGVGRWLIPAIAGGWSVFQLVILQAININSDLVRTIHLAFAIALVYLSYPAFRKHRFTGILGILSAKKRIPILDLVLAGVAALAALYYAIDYVEIGKRSGDPLLRDIVIGILLIIMLLEAARRSLGPALPAVAGLFIAYGFLGPRLPDIVAFAGISLNSMINQQTMSTEGIYGIPLYISSSTIFLFVLFGSMLETTGGGKYFVQLAFSLLGHYRGGPAKAAVLASGLTGMVSGSSIANVVTTGTFTIPLMKKCGYPAEKAGAIEVAASTNGQLMPPIMGAAAFIIAELCGIAYLEVVRAAFIPAVVSYLALIYITHLEACKLGLKGIPRAELPSFVPVFTSGIHFLIPLGALIYMIVIGYSAERSAFYGIIALAASVMVRQTITAITQQLPIKDALFASLKLLLKSLVTGARNMMGIGVACAAAGIIVGIVGMGPGQRITGIVHDISGGNLYVILLMTAIASLILGMGLPTTANYIVMATLTAGIIFDLARDSGLVVPLIAAHLFVFFFGILADDTPPVGLAAYAASAIARSDPIKTGIQGFVYDMRTAILPFMFFFNTDLLLIGIDSLWYGAAIFVSACAAMFAFAALTQGYFFRKNRWYESVCLFLVAAILLRPALAASITGLSQYLPEAANAKLIIYATGILLLAAVAVAQRRRTPL